MQQERTAASRDVSTRDDESRPRYRPDVDGLRAIAVLAVVLYHVHLPGFGGGFVGVDVFFVISGFLIGGIVFRDVAAGRYSFVTFYARRAKRILPALLCMILVVSLFALAMFETDELRAFATSDAAALIGGANIRYWALAHYFAIDGRQEPLVITWSLGVEEQFYLLMPPLMLLLYRLSPRTIVPAIALVSLLSLALSAHLTGSQPSAAFFLLPGRAWELGVGVLIALWQAQRRRPGPPRAAADLISLAALAAVLGAIVLFDDTTRFPGLAALLPVLGTAALIVTATSRVNRWLLAAAPMRFVGLISYSWYLWHWPPLILAGQALGREPAPIEYAVLVLVSFAVACLSWRYIERPFRRRTTIANVELLKRYGMALLASLSMAGTCFAVA